jgi:hypothetical protein
VFALERSADGGDADVELSGDVGGGVPFGQRGDKRRSVDCWGWWAAIDAGVCETPVDRGGGAPAVLRECRSVLSAEVVLG